MVSSFIASTRPLWYQTCVFCVARDRPRTLGSSVYGLRYMPYSDLRALCCAFQRSFFTQRLR